MDVEENISITEPITTVDVLDDLFGFEAAQIREEKRDLTAENRKLHFKPWRVFINHIDSYHGKLLAEVRRLFSILQFYMLASISPCKSIQFRKCIKRRVQDKGRKDTRIKRRHKIKKYNVVKDSHTFPCGLCLYPFHVTFFHEHTCTWIRGMLITLITSRLLPRTTIFLSIILFIYASFQTFFSFLYRCNGNYVTCPYDNIITIHCYIKKTQLLTTRDRYEAN